MNIRNSRSLVVKESDKDEREKTKEEKKKKKKRKKESTDRCSCFSFLSKSCFRTYMFFHWNLYTTHSRRKEQLLSPFKRDRLLS